jgi:hypothetical protein
MQIDLTPNPLREGRIIPFLSPKKREALSFPHSLRESSSDGRSCAPTTRSIYRKIAVRQLRSP